MAARPLKLSCWLLLLLFAILVHASEKDDPVSVSGSIAARSILQNELLRFTFTIRNRSDIPLESVRLVSVPDSYELRSICVPVSEQPVQCWEGRDFSLPHHALADAVAPGQSITVWGYLKPINTHKTASLAVLVSCRNAATSKESWLAIPLGENQVQDRSEVWLIRVYEFIKVFAIPIALALVGFGLDWIAKRREERREDARRTEEERKNIQQKQALRSETWKQMLPVSHSYSKYYLSLSLASERLASHLRNLNIAVETRGRFHFSTHWSAKKR
jgi:hypothetical protein